MLMETSQPSPLIPMGTAVISNMPEKVLLYVTFQSRIYFQCVKIETTIIIMITSAVDFRETV